MADEDFDTARQHVERALWFHGGRASTNLLAARIERERGDYVRAERQLARCQELDGVTEALQLEWLLLRCERGEVDELAPELLAAVTRDHPASIDLLESMARVYMTQTRYREALTVLDTWLERAPDSPRTAWGSGWVNNQLDQRGRAIDDYTRRLELRAPPRQLFAYGLPFELPVDSSRHMEAVPHLERLRAEQYPDSDVGVALAACRVVQGRIEDARQLLDEVLVAHPDHFAALRCAAAIWSARPTGTPKRSAGCGARWNRSRSTRRPATRSTWRCTRNRIAKPRPSRNASRCRSTASREVTLRLTRLIRTDLLARPNDPDLAAEAGDLLLRLGEDRRGVYWLNKALSIDPAHAASHRALSAYYERTNDPVRLESRHRRFVSAGNQQK